MINVLLLLMLLLLLFFAIRAKVSSQKTRRPTSSIPDEIKLSPFSKALAEIVAIAGGIYISLSLLISFLNLSIPEQILIADSIRLDPVAMLAIIIAIIQPLVVKVLNFK
ncbi:MAG: hypothetical protein SCK28_13500 [Bacillota bacterium]|nr:hypothetical protein [Bacillota bacterium]